MSGIAMLLSRLHTEQARFGDKRRAGALTAEIDTLGCEIALPKDYADFLRLSNGLEWDGVIFYACADFPETGERQGLIGMNEVWTEVARAPGRLYVGETDMDLLAALPRGGYVAIDRISEDIVEEYADFEALFAAKLEPRL